MRKGLWIAGLAAVLTWLPAAYAADASGTWKGAFDFEGSSVALTFHLTVANGAVTGSIEGLPTTPTEIHGGKMEGDTVTFWVNTDYQGQTYKLVYTGKMSAAGNEIAFTFGTDDGSWGAQLTAAKSTDAAPALAPVTVDVSGTWKGTFAYNGTPVALAIHLTNTAGAVSGSVEGLPTSPTEIHDGKLAGDTLTFWVNTDYEGQTYKLVYTGKVSAGQIVFTMGTEDGSWSTELTAEKAGT